MNIKQAEILSGVSSQNIRFYERHGLIRPARNPENDYREYTEADILTLKQIRTMRMLDMPLEQIASLLNGRIPFRQAMQSQKDLLETRAQQLATAIRFCEELSDASDLSSLDVDEILSRMESPGSKPGLFSKWVDDYRKFSTAEHEKTFTFFPRRSSHQSSGIYRRPVGLCQSEQPKPGHHKRKHVPRIHHRWHRVHR